MFIVVFCLPCLFLWPFHCWQTRDENKQKSQRHSSYISLNVGTKHPSNQNEGVRFLFWMFRFLLVQLFSFVFYSLKKTADGRCSSIVSIEPNAPSWVSYIELGSLVNTLGFQKIKSSDVLPSHNQNRFCFCFFSLSFVCWAPKRTNCWARDAIRTQSFFFCSRKSLISRRSEAFRRAHNKKGHRKRWWELGTFSVSWWSFIEKTHTKKKKEESYTKLLWCCCSPLRDCIWIEAQ